MPRNIQEVNEEQVNRENALKNVVMRIIIEIRERKKRPNLADFIAIYREKKNEPGASKDAVKKEFQNKFKMLYGDQGEASADQEKTDQQFGTMMVSFNRLQDQLNSQQQQLVSLIKQVNALIDHRDKKEGQMLKQADSRKNFKVIKAKQAMKNKSQSYQVEMSEGNFMGKASKKTTMPLEESKDGEQSASARNRANEKELAVINEGYMNRDEDQTLQGLPKNVVKKAGQQTTERQFAPFKSPFTEEIINTSKEVTSHKTN